MSKLQIQPRFSDPLGLDDSLQRYLTEFKRELTDYLRQVAVQVNGVSEGNIASAYNAQTSAPTDIIMQVGDVVAHKDPTETGTAGSKYVLKGWMALTEGTASAGSVVELRIPTGN